MTHLFNSWLNEDTLLAEALGWPFVKDERVKECTF